jgi:tagatose 1,6-diphosphate aldolase
MTSPDAPDTPKPTPTPVSAVVLTARGLTPGKYRGLQRVSHAGGTLTVLALDQIAAAEHRLRAAFQKAGIDRAPTFDEMVAMKVDLARELAPAASGVVLDGRYGAWPAIASGAVPPATGVFVRLEMSNGPGHVSGSPRTRIEPGWSVEKIKMMGCDGAKLLLPFDPFEPRSAEAQLATLERVADECRRFDLLFLLETTFVPPRGLTATDDAYLDRKPAVAIETARLLSRYGDLYGAEFPGTLDRDSDDQLMDNLDALSGATERPWLLTSSGASFDVFIQQAEMAAEAGASGVVGGRALWGENEAWQGRDRIAQARAIVHDRATPWFDRYGLSPEDLAAIRPAEGWHARLWPPGRPEASGGDGP